VEEEQLTLLLIINAQLKTLVLEVPKSHLLRNTILFNCDYCLTKSIHRRTILQESTQMACNTIQDLQLLATNRSTWRCKTYAQCAPLALKEQTN
jgi:hypothetical protein